MKPYRLESIQKLPISLEHAWSFFSSPENLKDITPSHLGFKITSPLPEDGKMYAGQIITYWITPIAGIPLRWMTEITHVKDKVYFVDEQRFGPYVLWHHTHSFKEIEGGIEMKDSVYYGLPFGWIGQLAHALFIGKMLRDLFDYRKNILAKKFGVYTNKN